MQVDIQPVTTRRELKAFIKLPWQLYDGDPNWVPPLILDLKKMLDRKKNPFFLHSEAEYFLARKNGEIAGRIAAILNRNHNNAHDEKTGFFGFFECIDDTQVANALLDAAKAWAKDRGMTRLRGPANFSTNDTCGLLIEGFDSPPAILMTYNPPYYLKLLADAGFQKIKELYAYMFTHDMPIPDRFKKFAEKVMEDPTVSIRGLDLKDFKREVEIVKTIYNDAWQNNWGFVPMTDEEFDHLASDLKPVVDPEIAFIARVNGEPAGFSLALPDYNEILKDLNGRLLPFGIFKLLWRKNKIKRARVITLGVRTKYQKKRGLAPAFYYETYRRGTNKGYEKGEFSWILEDNVLMNRALEGLGAKLYKRYAFYEQEI